MDFSQAKLAFSSQRDHFYEVKRKSIEFRKLQLKNLKASILKHEKDIYKALYLDLKKSEQEVFFTELGIVLNEIDYFLSNIHRWSRNRSVATPFYLFPSESYIRYEPRGVCLIVVPFNYPFQLCFLPLIGAIGAGNCAMIKGSEQTLHTNEVIKKILQDGFSSNYICFLEGDRELSSQVVCLPFDLIFFTGSSHTGKKIMMAAAENLTPVVLELGGKSPCLVHFSANLKLAAKRIVWGKFVNAGQTCIAPDFLVVHQSVKEILLPLLVDEIESFFGKDALRSPFYGKIIDFPAYERILRLIDKTKIFYGGEVREEDLFISPTILVDVDKTSALAHEEIFGPVLPIWTFDTMDDIKQILPKESPLALYVFGSKKWTRDILEMFPSGGACINDVLIHVSNKYLPFGGVGQSGLGSYHGHKSFTTFSHERSIVEASTWFDLIFRYPPYLFFSWIKKLFRL